MVARSAAEESHWDAVTEKVKSEAWLMTAQAFNTFQTAGLSRDETLRLMGLTIPPEDA